MEFSQVFLRRMEEIFSKEELSELLLAIEARDQVQGGLRFNKKKIDKYSFLSFLGEELEEVSFCDSGFYYDSLSKERNNKLSLSPIYYGGLIYIQEPSAMVPGYIMDIRDDIPMKVLDLCAAPGGKTSQLSEKIGDNGFLLSNEINLKRCKGLIKNVQLLGLSNTVVSNCSPRELVDVYGSYFNRILVDAPCSGEGTFRKDKSALGEYERYGDGSLTLLQREIMDSVHLLLEEGGELVYSTCTFNFEENEGLILDFLNKYDGYYEVVDQSFKAGIKELGTGRISKTYTGSTKYVEEVKTKSIRVLPHLHKGEGHFACTLRKIRGHEDAITYEKKKREKEIIKLKNIKEMDEQVRETINQDFNIILPKYYYEENNKYYLFKEPYLIFKGKYSLYGGLYLGELTKNKFNISHGFIMALKKENFKRFVTYNKNAMELDKYLKGETLMVKGDNGIYGILVDDYPLGYFKIAGNFKNMYPKNWRKAY